MGFVLTLRTSISLRIFGADRAVILRQFVSHTGFTIWTSVRETHMFHLCVGDMTPTLQDVAMLTGLPIDGLQVTGLSRPFDVNELCLRLLGMVPPRTAYRGDNLKLTWLESEFKTPPDDFTYDQLIMYA
ncbi:hypothetical protein Acr_00g0089810 [Actinidia rufa]|uniref:Aminotransferase-like plant mobile domain-containing protein n=1 Tax=Actinidia rufa TaxID=165716 RepID=A0A7J0DXY6_9ERIC|nr:hypothetical protein Acr_00g0089810 [Actinidia rufa]